MHPESGTVIRAGIETVVNPLDQYAIEAALRLRERYGGTARAITMGPSQAARVLKEAVAMGCDSGALLSDRKFGGSDTYATSYALAQMIKGMGGFDIVVCGARATDGDTSQVGPGMAAWLDIPVITYVSRIKEIDNGRIFLERLTEEGYEQLSTAMPCLVTVVKEIAAPRLPTLRGKIRSMESDMSVYSAGDFDIDPQKIGLAGSPTKVVKIDIPKVARNGKTVIVQDEESLETAVREFTSIFERKGLL
jgi:electron transfer flavoprotein beta subunit